MMYAHKVHIVSIRSDSIEFKGLEFAWFSTSCFSKVIIRHIKNADVVIKSRHFTEDNTKCSFGTKIRIWMKIRISVQILLEYDPTGPIVNLPALA